MLSGIALQICGQPAIVEGTTILLGENTLEVERACSGLRMFYGITALAFASIVIMRPGIWKAIVIGLAIAPVAVLMNVLRITATGVLTEMFPDAKVEAAIHDWAGVLVLPVAMLVFLGLIALMNRIVTAWKQDARRTAPWLIGGVAVCCMFLLLGTWRYRAQFQESTTTLWKTAQRLKDEGKLTQALGYLDRYIRARPDDAASRVQLAELFAEAADTEFDRIRAVELLRDAYEADPTRQDLAVQAIDIALQLQDFEGALDLLGQLQQSDGTFKETDNIKAIELVRKRADALLSYMRSPAGLRQAKYTWEDVARSLGQSLESPNYPPSHALALAVVTREHSSTPSEEEREADADAIMNDMVSHHQQSAEALLARYRYSTVYGTTENSFDPDADLTAALSNLSSASPKAKAEVLLTAAGDLRQTEPEKAVAYLDQAIAADPTSIRAYLLQSELLQMLADDSGDGLQSASAVLRKGLAENETRPLPLVVALAELLARQGDRAGMDELLQPVRDSLPNISDSWYLGYAQLGIARAESMITRVKGSPSRAVAILGNSLSTQESANAAERFPDDFAAGWQRLGLWLSELDRHDEAVSAWKRVQRIAPSNSEVCRGLAAAALEAGDYDLALKTCEQRVQLAPDSGDAWVQLAQIQLGMQLLLPANRRNFAIVEAALLEASKTKAPRDQFLSTLVDLRRAQDRRSEAVTLLEKELSEDSSSPTVWRLLTLLYLETNNVDAAKEAVERLAANSGSPVTVAALRANVSVAAGDPKGALEQLEASRMSAQGIEQIELAVLSAALHRQVGEMDRAAAILEDVQKKNPLDIRLLENLAQLSVIRREWDELSNWILTLKNVEGEDGTRWKAYRGMWILMSGQPLTDRSIAEVKQLARDVSKAHPRWALGPFLEAQAAVRQGHIQAATDQLEKSWQLGMQSSSTAEQLLSLLAAEGRTEEFDRFVADLGDLPLSNPGIFDQVMPSLIKSGQAEAAENQARKWVAENPDDPKALIRLGQVLALSGAQTNDSDARSRRQEEAESAFKKAVELDPTSLDSWLILYAHYLQTSKVGQAKNLLERIEQEVELDAAMKQMLLARLNSLAGDASQAVHYWWTAIQLAEKAEDSVKSNVQGQAAQFFAERARPLAIQLGEGALATNPDLIDTRILVAKLLGAPGSTQDTAAALEVVEKLPEKPVAIGIEKTRITILLLGERGTKDDINQALRLAESITDPTANDLRALAELYEMDGRIGAADELFNQLVNMRPSHVKDLIRYLDFWSKHFQADDRFAGRKDQVLDMLGRHPLGLLEQLRWRLKLLQAKPQGELTEAEAAGADESQSGVTTQQIQSEVSRFLSSRPARDALKEPSTAANLMAGVFGVLLDEGQLPAIRALITEPPTDFLSRAYATRLLANVLIRSPDRSSAAVALAQTLLEDEISADPKNLDLLRDAGDLAAVVGDNQRAEQLYLVILDLQPSNLDASNNLASLWIELDDKHDAALAQVDRSLADYPEAGLLRDTRGQILLLQGKAESALEEFNEAIRLDPASATAFLHKALALRELDRTQEAKEALATSLILGIEGQPKLPADQKWLSEIRQQLSL